MRQGEAALNAAGARYVLIGGFAVLAHGASRFTKDIDLLVDDAPENVALVKQGLAVLADNAAAEVDDHDLQDYVVVRVIDEIIVGPPEGDPVAESVRTIVGNPRLEASQPESVRQSARNLRLET